MIFTVFGRAADLKVKNIIQLTKLDDGIYYYPRFSPDNGKIFFTRSNFIGLLFYDLKQKNIIELNDDPGAGYQPVFTSDGESVFYRTYNYVNRRKYSSIVEQNIAGGQKKMIINNKRNLTPPQLTASGNLLLLDNSAIEQISGLSGTKNVTTVDAADDHPLAFIENTDIALVHK